MPEIRVLLVDDEPLVRRGLATCLAAHPDVSIVGEAGNGADAIRASLTLAPDLLFLDVQMPELDGFGVLAALQGSWPPAVIFVTAFEEYALRAFEVHAVDYLLKPFDQPRFDLALARARTRLAASAGTGRAGDHLARLLEHVRPGEPPYAKQLLVKTADSLVVLAVDDLELIEAEDNYVRLHSRRGRFLHREPLKLIAERLDPTRFLRIHRSAIVNVDRVVELRPLAKGEYVVVLASGAKLSLGRTFRDAFFEHFGRRSSRD